MPAIAFDALSHRYSVDGKPVPSVTQLLKAAGMIDDRFRDEAAMRRGTCVHQAVTLDWNEGGESDLSEDGLDPFVLGCVEGFRKWRREMGVEILANEQRVYHPHMGYGGTYDLLAGVAGTGYWIFDIKSGAPQPWHPGQLAAYAMAYQFDHPKESTPRRAGLYLSEDGKYRFQEYRDRSDFDLWKAAVLIGRWRIEKGLAT